VNTESLSAHGILEVRTRRARNIRANGFNGGKNYVHKNLVKKKQQQVSNFY
jgi:hypothetical protein